MKVPEILQVETAQTPGSLASVLNVIAEMGLVLEHVTTVRREQGRIAADAKSLSSVLAFPGLFAGALRCGARDIDDRMLLAAAHAIAEAAPQGQLAPDPLNAALHEIVTAAVAACAA